MRSYPVQDRCILILHLTLDYAFAERLIVSRRGNPRFPRSRRVVGSVCHAERVEYFSLAEAIQCLFGDSFESQAEKDEADVAVFGMNSGVVFQGGRQCFLQKRVSCCSAEIEFLVRR